MVAVEGAVQISCEALVLHPWDHSTFQSENKDAEFHYFTFKCLSVWVGNIIESEERETVSRPLPQPNTPPTLAGEITDPGLGMLPMLPSKNIEDMGETESQTNLERIDLGT